MTKQQLLNQTTEQQIVKFYVPDYDEEKKKNYKSPFSDKDNKPSLSFYKEGNTLKFKSHNTNNAGDVFQFVADIKNIDCKKNFTDVVNAIANDLHLNRTTVIAKNNDAAVIRKDVKKNIKISYEKAYTTAFLNYFNQFKIDLETLMRFKVFQVKYHEFISANNKLCKFDYRKNNQVAVCYKANERIKIYFPEIEGIQKKSFGFKDQTTEDIFGLEQLQQCENLFVAAGEKDCLALNANKFSAVSFQSENHTPTKEQVEQIQKFSSKIFIIYDNDAAGKSASEKICKQTGWQNIALTNVKDVADFFSKNSAEDFQNVIASVAKQSVISESKTLPAADIFEDEEEKHEDVFTIFHNAEKYLSKNYKLRFNTIKLEIEIATKNSNEFFELNENDLFCELNKRGIKIGMDKLIAILKSNYVEKFNPIHFYFKNLPAWRESEGDYIEKLCSYITCDEHTEFSLQFAKWIIRCVRCSLEEGYYNKQAFILVHSKQNSGKTTFCRFLCPPQLKDYQTENISDDKDSKIAIAKNFLINLDELSSLAKHEINSLKSLFSKDIINERLPYDRKNSIIHRVASFIGSTNMAEFLTDETGSVRWLCFEIKSINWHYKTEIDINKVWAQAYALYREGIITEMNREEIEKNESRNAKFQQRSTEAEIIPNFLKPSEENTLNAVFLTASDILLFLSTFTTVKLNKIMVGRAMPLCGFQRTKDTHSDRYGYWCIKLK